MASYVRKATSRVHPPNLRDVLRAASDLQRESEMAGVASFGAYELGEAVGTRMLAVKQFKSDYKRLEKTDHEHTVFAVCFVPRVAALRKCCNLSCVRYKKDNSS